MRCPFCAGGVTEVDYKDVAALRPYLTERNGIRRRSKPKPTGVCRRHQRQLARAIKRARFMALLPAATHPRRLPPPQQTKEVNKR